ncbi:hypothetical protein EJB05_43166, partial [Eragrostis curvula]
MINQWQNTNGAPRDRGQSADSTTDQNPQSTADQNPQSAVEKESETARTSEDKAARNVNDQNIQVPKKEESKPSPVSVTQALDALTGFDDSTQMAVNSVFGVIENMIDQFEKQQDSENAEDSDDNVDGTSVRTESHVRENTENSSSGEDLNHNLIKQKIAVLQQVIQWCLRIALLVGGGPDYLLDIAVNSYLKAQHGKFPDSTFESNEWNNAVVTKFKPDTALKETLTCFIRDELSRALKTEVGRKVGITNSKQLEGSLANDVELVADQVSKTIVFDSELYSPAFVQRNPIIVKFGATNGKDVVEAVSTAVQQSQHLRNILPVGVIVGVTLAYLRNYFHVGVSMNDDDSKASVKSDISSEDLLVQDSRKTSIPNDGKQIQIIILRKLVGTISRRRQGHRGKQNKDDKNDGMSCTTTSSHHKGLQEESVELEETAQEKSQNNLMSSFAEKALSVAAPIVPTKGDGEVDHERLVAVLAELGQKGGVLRFIGKIALLWGGIRGAMSLTDRLISFLRISERPLFQRIMGFSFMVLVLWSPVLIPLLPTLVQSWTISASTGIVGYACIVGLYVSIMILVMIWGNRIRGYENPMEQYGMDIGSASRVQEFFKGLIGGITVVGLVHSISILLGLATFRTGLSVSSDRPFDLIKSYSNVFVLALRGFATATSIAVVEEMVFRSWLPEEIAVDLGYYNAILISGVAFSLIHRSLHSVPGFLLLSLVLFGLKQRTQGKLAAPIGLRSGIMTASYLIQSSGFISSKPETPFWLVSTYHLHPFDGVIGLSICSLLAILFFPQKPVQKDTSV